MKPKPTLSIIEDVVTYRDQIADRAVRDMLADVANELSRLHNEVAGLRSLMDEDA